MLNATQTDRIQTWNALVGKLTEAGALVTQLRTDLAADRRLAYDTEGQRGLQMFDSSLGDHIDHLVGEVLAAQGFRSVIANPLVARGLRLAGAPMEGFAPRVERVVAPAGNHW